MNYTVNEVLEFVETNDVKFIRLAFCDLFGKMKNISILPSELKRAFQEGIPFDASAVEGFAEVEHSDYLLMPDPSTLNILPWRPQQGRVIRFYCNILTPECRCYEYDTRHILEGAVQRAEDMGYQIKLGVESEFYMFKTDEEGNPTEIPYDQGTYLDVAPEDKCENIRREICLCIEEMGLGPESSHHETGPGQNEIDFNAASPVQSADNLLTFKAVVNAVASRNGLHASFLPKPLKNQSGNGLHLNVSVYRDGRNLFDVPDATEAYAFMAGVLEHMEEMTLFFNPLPSSYLRFGSFEAPKYITWSEGNRSQLIRIPAAKGDRKRFELRSPDPCVNPYLAFALLIHAGLDGILHEAVLPPSDNRNMNLLNVEEQKLVRSLPASLKEAVRAAKESDFIVTAIGEKAANKYIAAKEKLS